MAQFPFPCLQKLFGSCCSPALVNSFTIRLLSGVTIFPLLSWWLIGFVYVPFVKAPQLSDLHHGDNDCGEKTEHLKVQKDEEAQGEEDKHIVLQEDNSPTKRRRRPKRSAKGVCGDVASPIVEMNIPSCVFLKKARDFYGTTEKGNAACLNE